MQIWCQFQSVFLYTVLFTVLIISLDAFIRYIIWSNYNRKVKSILWIFIMPSTIALKTNFQILNLTELIKYTCSHSMHNSGGFHSIIHIFMFMHLIILVFIQHSYFFKDFPKNISRTDQEWSFDERIPLHMTSFWMFNLFLKDVLQEG